MISSLNINGKLNAVYDPSKKATSQDKKQFVEVATDSNKSTITKNEDGTYKVYSRVTNGNLGAGIVIMNAEELKEEYGAKVLDLLG